MGWFVLILCIFSYAECRNACDRTRVPLELGDWTSRLEHMDSAVIDNQPVSFNEGQIFVYENDFPGYIIRYINVDNLAMNTCGARATLKNGGIGTNTVLIVLQAQTRQGIRTVVDIWGTRDRNSTKTSSFQPNSKSNTIHNLFSHFRAISHNKG